MNIINNCYVLEMNDSKHKEYLFAKFKCMHCDYVFYQLPFNIRKRKGAGCCKCNNEYMKKIHIESAVQSLSNMYNWMKTRCYNPNTRGAKYYIEKGITICDEWLNDRNKFYFWAFNNGWSKGATIDRIDNNKGYCPSNCRFVPKKQQPQNRTNTLSIDKVKYIKKFAKENPDMKIGVMARILNANYHNVYNIVIRKYWNNI